MLLQPVVETTDELGGEEAREVAGRRVWSSEETCVEDVNACVVSERHRTELCSRVWSFGTSLDCLAEARRLLP